MRNLLLLALLLIYSAKLIACDCPVVAPLTKAECGKFEVIVKGKIELVESCKGTNTSAIFFINEVYRGNINENSLEFYFDCASSCGMSFEKGEEWLLYLKKIDGKLIASLCDRNRKFMADSTQDFYASTLQTTFEEECNYLRTNIGFKKVEQGNSVDVTTKYTDITKRENKWSDRWNTVILLCVSLVGFAVIYYAFKKFVK